MSHAGKSPEFLFTGGGGQPGKSHTLDVDQLDRAATAPVLKLDGLRSPVDIDSIRLLK